MSPVTPDVTNQKQPLNLVNQPSFQSSASIQTLKIIQGKIEKSRNFYIFIEFISDDDSGFMNFDVIDSNEKSIFTASIQQGFCSKSANLEVIPVSGEENQLKMDVKYPLCCSGPFKVLNQLCILYTLFSEKY